MTTKEFELDLSRRLNTIRNTQSTIVDHVRALVPVLKDAGRPNSAEELQALLFLLDAQSQDLENHMMQNGMVMRDWLKERANRP